MTLTRALAWFAIAAQVVFIGAWIVAGALETGYSHLDHYVSELGADGAADPLIVNAAIVLLGLSFVALAAALVRVLPPRRSARVAGALLAAAGLAIAIAGPFNTECSTAVDATCQARLDAWDVDASTKVHAWAALAAQVLLMGTPFALARALWDGPAGVAALALGVAGLGIAVAGTVFFGVDGARDGLTQRLSLASLHLWAVLLASGVLWTNSRRSDGG